MARKNGATLNKEMLNNRRDLGTEGVYPRHSTSRENH